MSFNFGMSWRVTKYAIMDISPFINKGIIVSSPNSDPQTDSTAIKWTISELSAPGIIQNSPRKFYPNDLLKVNNEKPLVQISGF